MHNNVEHVIKIHSHYRPGYVTELSYENCFATLADPYVTSIPPNLSIIFYDCNDISISLLRDLEIELPNGIKNYRDIEAVNIITRLVNKYPPI